MFGNLWTSRYSSLLNFTGVNERIALAKKAMNYLVINFNSTERIGTRLD